MYRWNQTIHRHLNTGPFLEHSCSRTWKRQLAWNSHLASVIETRKLRSLFSCTLRSFTSGREGEGFRYAAWEQALWSDLERRILDNYTAHLAHWDPPWVHHTGRGRQTWFSRHLISL